MKSLKQFISENNINEKVKYPKGFDAFIDLAKKSKDGKDFVDKARKIKGVKPEVSQWFFDKYDVGFNMNKAADKFIGDVNKGLYENCDILDEASHNELNEGDKVELSSLDKEKTKIIKSVAKALKRNKLSPSLAWSGPFGVVVRFEIGKASKFGAPRYEKEELAAISKLNIRWVDFYKTRVEVGM